MREVRLKLNCWRWLKDKTLSKREMRKAVQEAVDRAAAVAKTKEAEAPLPHQPQWVEGFPFLHASVERLRKQNRRNLGAKPP